MLNFACMYLIKIEPIPDNTDEEADGKHPPELDKPRNGGPKLTADDHHYD